MTASQRRAYWIARSASPGRKAPPARLLRVATRAFLKFRARCFPEYRPPSEAELSEIEARLDQLGVCSEDFLVEHGEFQSFMKCFRFPADYYGDVGPSIFEEKMLEHFVAWKLLRLDSPGKGRYVDIAACASPWARLLRAAGVDAWAIDLDVSPSLSHLPYYLQGDATQTVFPASSLQGASLQCAFEMFAGEQDQALVRELARILTPGGRVVISPLYMHTHPCYYQTPEFLGHTGGDPGATAYVRRDCWGVLASRKYSPETLLARVWNPAVSAGLRPRLLVLRNKRDLGSSIYLHFILLLEKPGEGTP